MPTELEQENRRLRRQLKTFVAQARENEAKLQRFNNQELQLIGAASIPELISLVLQGYPRTFQLDSISLLLLDPEYELQRLLQSEGVPAEQTSGLLLEPDASSLRSLFPTPPAPRLGTYQRELHRRLFPSRSVPLHSCALLPLLRHGELIGSLNMGSADPARFISGSGTDFLERLAAVLAISLENCTNHQRLKRIGLTDPLTGINNRRYFDQRMLEEVARAQRAQTPLACMFLDLDHFKQINDRHGHQTGDRVLQELALLFSTELRQSDILCRYGGEEFVVLLPGTTLKECQEIAERLRQGVERHHFRRQTTPALRLSVSIGIAALQAVHGESHETQADALLASADKAVYEAKSAGRNRVMLNSPAAVLKHPSVAEN